MTQARLNQLIGAIGEAERVLILPHNNPDPDAIASAVALRYLLAEKFNLESYIAYQGIIGRAENRALVRYLNHPLQLLTEADLNRFARGEIATRHLMHVAGMPGKLVTPQEAEAQYRRENPSSRAA